MIEKIGRSWTFALGVLVLATVMGGITIWNDQRQWATVTEWWSELAKWLILTTGGIKAVQKIGTAVAGKEK